MYIYLSISYSIMTTEKKGTISLWSEPNYNTGWQVLAKWAIGLTVGLLVWFLIFIILFMTGDIMTQAQQNNVGSTGTTPANPLIPLIFIVIAFIATFIGNVILAGVYNLFYSTKYYDLWKMFSNSLLSNVIIFFVFIPLYLVFYNNMGSLYTVLGFHIIFAIFACYTHVEILTNPNYSSSHLIGTTIGSAASAMLFILVLRIFSSEILSFIALIPPLIWYFCIPVFHAMWEKVYYKFYENGNDFLYLPTLQEINQQEGIINQDTNNNDITVDIE